jgi:hypothetical protein
MGREVSNSNWFGFFVCRADEFDWLGADRDYYNRGGKWNPDLYLRRVVLTLLG